MSFSTAIHENASRPSEETHVPTAEFASPLKVKPASVRRRLCITGSYFGVVPRKMLNGRLLWPKSGQKQLLAGIKISTGSMV